MSLTTADAKGIWSIERHESLVSTNDEAMRRAREGHEGNLWILADRQTGGRGRTGRQWHSPPGNLYASLLLINPAPVPQMPELGFVAGVALASSLRDLLDGDERLKIKWPNDMLYGGAKLSGLMLEGAVLPDGRFACVIGMGVNCAVSPQGLAYPATSLAAILQRPVSTADVFATLATHMQAWLSVYQNSLNFISIRHAWLGLAVGVGQPVDVMMGERRVAGLFSGIDSHGRLILTTPDGDETIAAGDVFFRHILP